MWYRVSGVNRSTGQEGTFNVQANSREEAEQAAQRSMIVSEIDLEPGYNPPPPPPPVPPGAVVPDYKAITGGATVLRVLALLSYGCATLCAFGFIIAIMASLGGMNKDAMSLALPLIAIGISQVICGAILNMLAAVGEAVRDMARNSFHLPGESHEV